MILSIFSCSYLSSFVYSLLYKHLKLFPTFFFFKLGCFLMVEFWEMFLCTLDASPLSDNMLCKYFLLSCGLSFYFPQCPWLAKVFSKAQFVLLRVVFLVSLFGAGDLTQVLAPVSMHSTTELHPVLMSCFRNLCLIQGHRSFLL